MNEDRRKNIMYYKEEIKKTLEGEIEAIKVILANVDYFVPVIKKFNGKVINKRFFDAIATLRHTESNSYFSCSLYSHKDNSLKFTINQQYKRSFYSDFSFTPDCLEEGRLNSEKALKGLYERIEGVKIRLSELLIELSNLDEITEEYITIYDQIAAFEKKTSGFFKDQLNYRCVY